MTTAHAGTEPILDVRDLTIDFASEDGPVRAVDGVSFTVRRGEIVGLVGESGAGKTLTSEAILRLLRCPPARLHSAVRRPTQRRAFAMVASNTVRGWPSRFFPWSPAIA